jgi:catecholate siderophore receptor
LRRRFQYDGRPVADKHYKLQLNVENMFDRKYYASAHSDSNIMPGASRTLRVTLNATF